MRWYNTLYTKLTLSLTVILLLMGLAYTLFALYVIQQQNLSSHQIINRSLAENLIKYRHMVVNEQFNQQALKQTFNEYMDINPGIEIYQLDLAGNILTHSATLSDVKRTAVRLEPIKSFLANNGMYPLTGDNPRILEQQTPFSVAAIPNNENPQGYLYVILKNNLLGESGSGLVQSYLRLGSGILGASLLFALLAGLIVFNRLTLRLKLLQKHVDEFAASHFKQHFRSSHKTSLLGGDEIDHLERHIISMSKTITQQWSALKQQDKLRREMVANISHDLRTPLASLQGYLETLVIKNDKLSKHQQKKYLAITLRQAVRLRLLIDDLFQLAKLESPVTKPEFESFSIVELLFDVADKISIRTSRKNVELQVNAPPKNLIVYADIGMIERVLDNLLRNALNYTPKNGLISLSVIVNDKGLIEVSVHDTGIGIPKDQQPLIFDRFYQVNNPQRTGNTAGLGLAISNRIIELHKQTIWVKSQAGEGATFYFTLNPV